MRKVLQLLSPAALLAFAAAGLARAETPPAETQRWFLEAEDGEGAEERPWAVRSEAELRQNHAVQDRASGGSVACFPKLGGIGQALTLELPRLLAIGETVQVFCRVAYPRRGEQACWIEVGAGGHRVQFELPPLANPDQPRRLCWTEGQQLKTNVAGGELSLEVANPASEALVDLVFLTSCLADPAPSAVLDSESFSAAA